MIRYLVSAFLLLSFTFSFSQQSPTFDFARSLSGGSFGSLGYEAISAMDVDAAGNIYVTGQFAGTVDFDPGAGTTNLTSGGNYDVFIAKYNPLGNLIWARKIGGTQEDRGYDIAVSSTGEVAVVGRFLGTVDFDPGSGVQNLTASFLWDAFILKLNSSGNYMWAYDYGDFAAEAGTAVDIDNNGNVYFAGYYSSTLDFDPGVGVVNLTPQSGDDVFFVKYNSAGAFQFARSVGSSGQDWCHSMEVDANGNAYLTGKYAGTNDFDPGSGTVSLPINGNVDAFVIRLTSSGNLSWARGIGGNQVDEGLSIAYSPSNGIYLSGLFEGTVDFNPGSGTFNMSASQGGVFFLKLSLSGNFIWAKQIDAETATSPYVFTPTHRVTTDPGGNFYATGSFDGPVDFDPGSGTNIVFPMGSSDTYVMRLNSSGTFNWVGTIMGTGLIRSHALESSGTGSVILGGHFSGTADFDPTSSAFNMTAVNTADVFFTRYSQCTNTFSNTSVTACNSYTSAGGKTYTTSGVYVDTVAIGNGCFNYATINLTINNSDTVTDNVFACDSYTWAATGQTYTADGNYSATLTNTQGCDSLVTLALQLGQSDTGQDSVISCSDYVWPYNGNTYGASGTYTHTYSNADGCDSTRTLKLLITGSDTVVACDSYTWTATNQTYTNSGIYTTSIAGAVGCPATLTLDLTINNSNSGDELVVTCDSFFWPATGNTYFSSTRDSILLSNQLGCDSLARLDLTINNNAGSLAVVECDSFFWDLSGVYYFSSGIYSDTTTNAEGCDSVVTLDLTIYPSTIGMENIVSCDSFTWGSNGQTYFLSGTYYDTLINSKGCDSVSMLQLVLNQSNSGVDSVENCDNYSWPATGMTYFNSGLYQANLQNADGCDSLVTLVLTILDSDSSFFADSACFEYTWAQNGVTYTSSGVYTDTLINSIGCDSILFIDLEIFAPQTGTINASACDSLISPSGNFIWYTSGQYSDTVLSSDGCDSAITINLVIVDIDTSIRLQGGNLISNQNSATYQWYDCLNGFTIIPGATQQSFSPSGPGSYAVLVNKDGCSRLSACQDYMLDHLFSGSVPSKISVHPNPANETLYLSLGVEDAVEELWILNNSGKRFEPDFLSSSNEINISDLVPGFYTIFVRTSAGIGKCRFVKR